MRSRLESIDIKREVFFGHLRNDVIWDDRDSPARLAVNLLRRAADSSSMIQILIQDVAQLLKEGEHGTLQLTIGMTAGSSARAAARQVVQDLCSMGSIGAVQAVTFFVQGPSEMPLEEPLEAAEVIYAALGPHSEAVFGAFTENWLEDYCVFVILFSELNNDTTITMT